MREPARVFAECRRILRPEGIFIVSSINPAWADFNPSPHATSYLGAAELAAMLGAMFRSVEVRFGFAVRNDTVRHRALSIVKQAAVRLKLIPKTMRGKTLLKRLAFGKLVPVPEVLTEGFAAVEEPVAAALTAHSRFRTIYLIART
jgi:hypothetical protein